MSINRSSCALAVAIALSLCACSTTDSRASAPYTVSSTQLTAEGSIIRVDKSNRMITIRNKDGEDFDVYASDDVRNFDQLQVGDLISMDYNSAVAVEIQPAGSAELGSTLEEEGELANPGAKPAGSVSDTVTLVAEIMGVDTEANTIALKGPEGNVVTLDVIRDDLRERLHKVKVGELLKVTMTEAVAVNVRPRSP